VIQTDPHITKAPWNGKKELVARTLVVDCSDGRLPDARVEFLAPPFVMGRHCPIFVPGGPGAIVSSASSPIVEEWMWGWIRMLHEANQFQRVIAIAHHDCKYYGNAHPGKTPEERHRIQLVELADFVSKVSEFISGAQIETFFAEPASCGHTQYRRISRT